MVNPILNERGLTFEERMQLLQCETNLPTWAELLIEDFADEHEGMVNKVKELEERNNYLENEYESTGAERISESERDVDRLECELEDANDKLAALKRLLGD